MAKKQRKQTINQHFTKHRKLKTMTKTWVAQVLRKGEQMLKQIQTQLSF